MKIRVVYKPDKKISIIHPVPNCKMPLEEIFNQAMNNPDLKGLPFEDIEHTELPMTRKYRNAWRKEIGKPISIDSTEKQKTDKFLLTQKI